jgi:hypothetical protein
VCKHLHLHGFGFVLDEEGLDVYQLKLLMVASWSILQVLGGQQEYPSDAMVKRLSLCEEIKAIVKRIAEDDQQDDVVASPVEQSCITLLSRTTPQQRTFNTSANHHLPLTTQTAQLLLEIWGYIQKQCQKKPKVKGVGYTRAVLSNMLMFVAFVELMLAYWHSTKGVSRESRLGRVWEEDISAVPGCHHISWR